MHTSEIAQGMARAREREGQGEGQGHARARWCMIEMVHKQDGTRDHGGVHGRNSGKGIDGLQDRHVRGIQGSHAVAETMGNP